MDFAPENTESRRVRFFRDSARDQAFKVSRQIVGTAVFLAVCMWSFIGLSLWSEYSVGRSTARTEEFNMAAALSGELTLTLDSVASTLRVIQDAFKHAPSAAALGQRLEQTFRSAAETGQDVRVVAPDGTLLFSVRKQVPESATVANQPPLAGGGNAATDQLTIVPVTDGAGHAISVGASVTNPDGQFAGEARVLLPPAALLSLQRELLLGTRGMVVVASADGMVLAGFSHDHPDGLVGIGTDLRGAPYPDHLKPGDSAVYMRLSKVDAVERMVTIKRLSRYPLSVLVALDMNDVLATARVHVWLICLVGLGATALITALTFLLVREVWKRTRREIELAADRERLQLAQAQIDIERKRLAETNRELVTSKERADVANKTKSQFLAHMSHELRTPLHAIIGFSELIRDQAPTSPGSPPLVGYATDILTSGRHLLDLINTILDISKIESGTAKLTETLFQVADIARNALVTIRSQADARHINLDLRMPDTPIRLFADRTRLLQVLINLLSNAVKFTPDDGQIVLSAVIGEGGELIISVIDSGIGMTEAEIKVALEPFGQVDHVLSRSFEGTGLGLPLAGRLAELHGGRLDISSIKGRGTAARVTLPAKRVGRRAGATA